MREREQSRFQIRERNGVDQDLAAVKIAEPVEPRALKDDVLCYPSKADGREASKAMSSCGSPAS
jgi:hypothetical protein